MFSYALMSLVAGCCTQFFFACSVRNATWFNLLICLFFFFAFWNRLHKISKYIDCYGSLDVIAPMTDADRHTHTRTLHTSSILLYLFMNTNQLMHNISLFLCSKYGENKIKLVSLGSRQKRLQIFHTSRHVYTFNIARVCLFERVPSPMSLKIHFVAMRLAASEWFTRLISSSKVMCSPTIKRHIRPQAARRSI